MQVHAGKEALTAHNECAVKNDDYPRRDGGLLVGAQIIYSKYIAQKFKSPLFL
jgi:hypothetical protein